MKMVAIQWYLNFIVCYSNLVESPILISDIDEKLKKKFVENSKIYSYDKKEVIGNTVHIVMLV